MGFDGGGDVFVCVSWWFSCCISVFLWQVVVVVQYKPYFGFPYGYLE
jgi:hypothetical protein